MAPKRKSSSAQHQRRGTPSTVSSAEPPILQSSSSQGPIENSDDESSELNAEESSPVVRQDRPAPLKESANAPQHESSDSDYGIPIANLTPPSVNRRWALPTQPSPLPVSPRPSGRVAPKPKARRRPFSRFKAYLNTRLPPSVVLDKRTRKELKMRPNIHTPTKPSQSFTEEQDASTIDQSEKAVLEQMAVTESRWVRPTLMTTEEEEMMREVTMKDLDEMFGDITFPASEEEIAARSEDDQAMSSVRSAAISNQKNDRELTDNRTLSAAHPQLLPPRPHLHPPPESVCGSPTTPLPKTLLPRSPPLDKPAG